MQEELLLQQTIKSMPQGIAIIDTKQKVKLANKKFVRTFSKTKVTEKVDTAKSLFGEKIWKTLKVFYLQALKGNLSENVHIAVNIKSREKFVASLYPIYERKKIVAVGITLIDNTETSNAKEALAVYQDRLNQAQKAGNIGVFEWDIRTNKIWWSNEEESLFGVAPGKFKGKFEDWILTVDSRDRVYVRDAIKKSLEGHKKLDVEFRVTYPGGITHWLRARARIFYKNGRPVRMVGIHYDVSVRRQTINLLTFKAEASRVLTSSLDYEATLTHVTHLATEYIADWCTIELLNSETQKLSLLAASHKDPKKIHWAEKIRAKYPPDMSQNEGLPYVIKTGEPLYMPLISQKALEQNAKNDKEKKLIQKLGLRSAMIIPLTVSNKTIGAITFVMAESKRRYTKEDFEIAKQLGSRASLAIENAELYDTVKRERERLDELLANAPAVVWEAWGDPTSKSQKITYISSFAERLLGYAREEWLTTPNFWNTIIHPDDQKSATATAKGHFDAGGTGVNRFRWLKKDGTPVWVESQSFVVKDKKGKHVGMRGVVIDITNTVEQDMRKDEFLSLASHELKTPVTTIKAFTQLLKKHATDARSHEYLEKMETQINKQTRLIAELLDISKIHEGKLELRRETILVDEFLSEIVDEMRAITKTHKIKTSLKSRREVFVDKDRLGQVITNLLTNAIKYSPNADRVIIRSKNQDRLVVIEIEDFGIGIAASDKEKIFSKFYRVGKATAPGLGVGLFISKEILKRHNGTIDVTTTPGNGSTFRITLPTI